MYMYKSLCCVNAKTQSRRWCVSCERNKFIGCFGNADTRKTFWHPNLEMRLRSLYILRHSYIFVRSRGGVGVCALFLCFRFFFLLLFLPSKQWSETHRETKYLYLYVKRINNIWFHFNKMLTLFHEPNIPTKKYFTIAETHDIYVEWLATSISSISIREC